MPSYVATAMLQRPNGDWNAFPLGCQFNAADGDAARREADSFFHCLLEAQADWGTRMLLIVGQHPYNYVPEGVEIVEQ